MIVPINFITLVKKSQLNLSTKAFKIWQLLCQEKILHFFEETRRNAVVFIFQNISFLLTFFPLPVKNKRNYLT
jgi:hypothetical protein